MWRPKRLPQKSSSINVGASVSIECFTSCRPIGVTYLTSQLHHTYVVENISVRERAEPCEGFTARPDSAYTRPLPSSSMTSSQYETSNVYLASYLLCRGATLTGYKHVSLRRVQFFFVSDEKLHELLRLYWGNVPFPLTSTSLFDSLRGLKSMVRRKPEKAIPPLLLPSPTVSPSDHAEQ